tara:strand:+ start:7676 stop:8011 length:336 start_codon:yes stop_codon:yes gene_type:complete
MANIEDSANEKVKEWGELSAYELKVITVIHANRFRDGGVSVSDERMFRILKLGAPKCVFGYREGKLKYARIHKDSVDVMKVITNNYLQKSPLEEIEEEFPDMLDEMRKEGF